MKQYYLAIDIGASSGRHILFHLENGSIMMEEIYRFENGMVKKDGHLFWDVDKLFDEIINGMKKCRQAGKCPVTLAIDTWAVDYVLLGKDGHVLSGVYGYRDLRTEGIEDEVYALIPEKELYERTGIQKQRFNTVFQLMADKKYRPEVLEKAENLLMLPDYFSYRLTGIKASEYTNSTSTQLVNAHDKKWDTWIIKRLGLPEKIFGQITAPGKTLGRLKKDVTEEVGFDCEVLCCASHDTASAVMAMPNEGGLYISSGTWSLMGVESTEPMLDEQDMKGNFTNEGGYGYRFRYLKNIMGLWMIQSVRHEAGDALSFEILAQMAEDCRTISSMIDVNDRMFLAPDSMTGAIREYCARTGQKKPESIAETAKVIFTGLADCYAKTVETIERNIGRCFDSINIIGGGCRNSYLNRLTAYATGKKIYAGPAEATAIGNALAQMIGRGEIGGLSEARSCVYRSFEIEKYDHERI